MGYRKQGHTLITPFFEHSDEVFIMFVYVIQLLHPTHELPSLNIALYSSSTGVKFSCLVNFFTSPCLIVLIISHSSGRRNVITPSFIVGTQILACSSLASFSSG